jgi:hypothetical protein
MFVRLLNTVAAVVLLGMLGVPVAHADVYTWVDAAGMLNVSNLQPPAGANVTSVVKSVAPKLAPDTSTPAQAAAMQALSDRILQLQAQVADVQRPVVPTVVNNVYVTPQPAPVTVQYAQLGYTYDGPQQSSNACDPSFYSCGGGVYGGFYPASTVFLGGAAAPVRPSPPPRAGQFMGPRTPLDAFNPIHPLRPADIGDRN